MFFCHMMNKLLRLSDTRKNCYKQSKAVSAAKAQMTSTDRLSKKEMIASQSPALCKLPFIRWLMW